MTKPLEIAAWRRQLRFRAWHRGVREMDLILGRFADRHLAEFSIAQLDRFAALLAMDDPDLYEWITGKQAVPAQHDHDVMRLLMRFRVDQVQE